MKTDTRVLIGFLVVVVTRLRQASAQDCSFRYQNGSVVSGNIYKTSIKETVATLTHLESFQLSNGTLDCSGSDTQFNTYIELSNTSSTLDLFVKRGIGNDFDDNLVEQYFLGRCDLKCQPLTTILLISITIEAENNQQPLFNQPSGSATLEESIPIGLDFSYLLASSDGTPLAVYDRDFPIDNANLVTFSVDNPAFEVLPPTLTTFNDSRLTDCTNCPTFSTVLRTNYAPRLAVAKKLDASQGPMTFNLIATDLGTPSKTTRFPITVTVTPEDLRDPKFNQPYYTASVGDADYTGVLPISTKIFAYDGDLAINEPVTYTILDNDDLELSLVEGDGGVDVVLDSAVGIQEKPIAYVVVEARQTIKTDRAATVVLVVQLPVVTTGTPSTTEEPATCPSFDPTTVCPDYCSTTNDPGTTGNGFTETTCPEPSCPPPDCSVPCPEPSTTPGNPGTHCPACPDNCTTTETPTATTPTECPITDCTETTLTNPTTRADSSTLLTCPPNDCSTGVPDTTSCPTCPTDCLTTVFDTTCPTTTPPGPTVEFDRQQYSSEIIENSDVGTTVVVLRAVSASGPPTYSLAESAFLSVDSASGVVTLAQSLAIGVYTTTATARIASGQEDTAKVVLRVVSGYTNGDAQFSSPLYRGQMDERTIGILGQVDLRNAGPDSMLAISSSDPPQMLSYFSVATNGSVSAVTRFNRTASGPKVLLTIVANLNNLRLTAVSTVFAVIVNDVNEAPEFHYPSPFVIGYPSRTYFDYSVPMPLYTLTAFDPDEGENAVLSYHLMDTDQDFDIDSHTGSLYTKGVENFKTERELKIVVKDSLGLQDTLAIAIKTLSENHIHQIKANGSETLTDGTIDADLTHALGFNVITLRKEKLSLTGSNRYEYSVILYAVDGASFVDRDTFSDKIKENENDLESLDWTLDTTVSGPADYAPATFADENNKLNNMVQELTNANDELSKQKKDLTVATGVLGGFLGLFLVIAGVYVAYVKKIKNRTPKSHTITPKDSLKQKDSNSLPNNKHQGSPPVNRNGRVLEAYSAPYVMTSATNHTIAAAVALNPTASTDDSTDLKANEDEVYCPPSPSPQRSILKESNSDKKQNTIEDKRLDRDTSGGVKFNPTAEVIQVTDSAPTVQIDEIVDFGEEDNNRNGDDDGNFLVEVL